MNCYNPDTQCGTFDWGYLVVNPLKCMLIELVRFIPNILIAVLILFIGWVTAHLFRSLVSGVMKSIGFNSIADKIGISQIEGKDNKKIEPNEIVGLIAFWGTILASFIIMLNNLQLREISYQLDKLFSYVITILVISIIAVVGIVLSMIVYKIIYSTAKSTGSTRPEISANISRWIILFFTVIVCLSQIGVRIEMLLMPAAIILGTLCITFIMAFGFGGRHWAERVLEKLSKKWGL
ncbi:MAG: hypothetical protein PHQ52_01765 [Candidatus Omnitrophica bacterium]|nr:hypothetical protein [Candidatus Omnitrophota bacterium]